ncbi:hypothetical protein XENTR_v10007194 [Xenopus tropicalis]|nr:hypothetical protein XENTR_v10007194 [Xenopus tropicalis]
MYSLMISEIFTAKSLPHKNTHRPKCILNRKNGHEKKDAATIPIAFTSFFHEFYVVARQYWLITNSYFFLC